MDDMEKGEKSQQQGTIRTPLITHRHDHYSEESNSGISRSKNTNGGRTKDQIWMVYLSTLVATCGTLEFGVCSGYSSPTQTAITEELGLSTAQFSLFGSISTCGAMIDALTSGSMADLIGRRGSMAVSSCTCIAGWITIYFSQGVVPLDIGRLLTGYGMGVFSYVVPIFIAEVTPKHSRGAFATLSMATIGIGTTVTFALGAVLSWRNLALIGIVPCCAQLIGVFFIPESPRWLAKMGQRQKFEGALQQLRGKDSDISKEVSEIQDYIETSQMLGKAKVTDLFQRKYMRSLMIGVMMMVFNQFCGANGILYYMSSILESIGFSSTLGSIIYSSFQVVCCSLSATRMDNTGRKPILLMRTSFHILSSFIWIIYKTISLRPSTGGLVSATGCLIGSVLVGTSYFLKVHQVSSSTSINILGVGGLMVYGGSYAAGLATIPWILMSEMFPVNVKGVAGSLASLVDWTGAWTVSYTFNYLILWSSYGTFFLYGAVNALAILFIVIMVPETKGKSLEAIQIALNI